MMVFGWLNLSLWVRIEVGRRKVGNRKKLDAVWVKTLWRSYIHCVRTKIQPSKLNEPIFI